MRAPPGDETADKKLFAMADRLHDDKDKTVAKEARFYQLEKRVLAGRRSRRGQTPPAGRAKCGRRSRTRDLEAKHLRIASATVRMINRVPSDDLAAKCYKKFGELFAKSDDQELSDYGRRIAKASRSPSLIGKPIAIAGSTLEGNSFDVSRVQGQSRRRRFLGHMVRALPRSLPGLMRIHKRFHKRGFEVVGVSLDKDLDALGKFLDENKLPWICLIGEKDGDEMKFPLAEKYEIQAIPTMFLVGKDGKIIGRDLSEKALEAKLDELLPKAGKSAGGKTAAK